MSSPGDLLPLFPLQIVLYPGSEAPLHIFEPRYRRMIRDAVREKSEFGIVSVRGQTIEAVGCTAIVEEITHRHEDGRFDIRVRGVRRFRTTGLDQTEDLLHATVEFFDDEPGLPLVGEEVEKLYDLAIEAAALAGVKLAKAPDPADPTPSFRAAEILPLELSFKQQLATLRSERERYGKLTEHLDAWLEREREKMRVRNISMSNGHARG